MTKSTGVGRGNHKRKFSHEVCLELNRLRREEGFSIMRLADRYDCDKSCIERGLKFYLGLPKRKNYPSDRKTQNCAPLRSP